MVKTIVIEQITLYDLEQKWGLEMSTDPNFFHGMARRFSVFDRSRMSATPARGSGL